LERKKNKRGSRRKLQELRFVPSIFVFSFYKKELRRVFNQVESLKLQARNICIATNGKKKILFYFFSKKIGKKKKNITIQDSNKRVKFVTRIREAMCLRD